MKDKMLVGSSLNTDISIQVIHTTASTFAASTSHIVQVH